MIGNGAEGKLIMRMLERSALKKDCSWSSMTGNSKRNLKGHQKIERRTDTLFLFEEMCTQTRKFRISVLCYLLYRSDNESWSGYRGGLSASCHMSLITSHSWSGSNLTNQNSSSSCSQIFMIVFRYSLLQSSPVDVHNLSPTYLKFGVHFL
jgi:hypothetical protein